jgi:hypothetical protein
VGKFKREVAALKKQPKTPAATSSYLRTNFFVSLGTWSKSRLRRRDSLMPQELPTLCAVCAMLQPNLNVPTGAAPALS